PNCGDLMKVHEKIRFIRESKNWSQEEMAEKLKMSVNGYSKIERGETKSFNPKLEQIAEILDVDLMELMPVAGRHICLISGDNTNNGDGHNINFGSSMELAFEIQKLQLINTHKDETIGHLKQDIARLTEMLELHKQAKA
ncbi:MAG: helix-turn-helix transcriptional regulator, partial [Methylococcales bacterium]|nr:helix-turn-helix transcriptional regulator [Methylococcales bacterium]